MIMMTIICNDDMTVVPGKAPHREDGHRRDGEKVIEDYYQRGPTIHRGERDEGGHWWDEVADDDDKDDDRDDDDDDDDDEVVDDDSKKMMIFMMMI